MAVKTIEETKKAMTPSPRQELPGAEATRPGRVFEPDVDIFESDAAITVLADMPGVEPSGLDVDLRDNLLTITGTVKKVEGGDERILLREYETGSFYRQFRLSSAVDQSRIDATLKDGVLRLTLPKAEAHRPRKIEIRT
jgi:HSP20 family molecular chaperone IbpA